MGTIHFGAGINSYRFLGAAALFVPAFFPALVAIRALAVVAVAPRLVQAVMVTDSALLETCSLSEFGSSPSLMNAMIGGSRVVEAEGMSSAAQLPSKVTSVAAVVAAGGGDDSASKATSNGTPSLTVAGTDNRRISRSPPDVCTNTVSEAESAALTNNTPSIAASACGYKLFMHKKRVMDGFGLYYEYEYLVHSNYM